MSGYPVKAVANYFLERYGKHAITPLKMQKLVYLANGFHLAYHDEPLVSDEYPEAWKYGPVFPSLYYVFKHQGRLPIIRPAEAFTADLKIFTPKISIFDFDTPVLLDRIWEVYGDYSGEQLSAITNRDDSPWHEVREKSGGIYNANIKEDDIKNYFRKVINERSK